jgi:hypothetical protein
MAKKKNLLEKAADAIDHALHPEPASPPVSSTDLEGPIEGHPCPVSGVECEKECGPDECKAEVPDGVNAEKARTPYQEHMAEWKSKPEVSRERIGVESSSQNSDLAKHPKFAKFKSQGDN